MSLPDRLLPRLMLPTGHDRYTGFPSSHSASKAFRSCISFLRRYMPGTIAANCACGWRSIENGDHAHILHRYVRADVDICKVLTGILPVVKGLLQREQKWTSGDVDIS